MKNAYFIGIDIGTQGARVVLLDKVGNNIATSEEIFPLTNKSSEEQDPIYWWNACKCCLQALIQKAKEIISLDEIEAISVTSTSGTMIPVDKNFNPLHHAIMYSDKRSENEGKLCSNLASTFHHEGYCGFNSSSGLSKMVWYVNNFPDNVKNIYKWLHATDYFTGMLSGKWGITDYTNVLKSGFDLKRLVWPDYLFKQLPLKKEWMCDVIAPGTIIGEINPSIAVQLQLPSSTKIVAGMTDGCASQIASGAVEPGDWNTTIGTTMVVKGITVQEVKDPQNRIYNHRHPDGYWMPGGAGNIGADWVTDQFSQDFEKLTEESRSIIPTGKMTYPLLQKGERFPFIAPMARGFIDDKISRLEQFTSSMEGVAYIERFAYEMIEKLSGEKVTAIYTAGGGSQNDVWLKIRSNVLNLPIYKMKNITGAVGAAILAASNTHFSSLIEATKAMTQIDKKVIPSYELVTQYNVYYKKFLKLLRQKEFITNDQFEEVFQGNEL
jgi:D-ribulokinase